MSIEWLKYVPMSSSGPVVLQSVLAVVLLLSAIAWVLMRRHNLIAAHAVLTLLKRAGEAIAQALRYPPEVERHIRRYEPYVLGSAMLVYWGLLLLVFGYCLVVFPVTALAFNLARMTWFNFVVVFVMFTAGLYLVRFCAVRAMWAWHSLKTGAPFTGHLPEDRWKHY